MAFPSEDKGSRILITTRRSGVASEMGVPNPKVYKLGPLTDEEGLELFKHAVRLDGEVDPCQLDEIGKRIVRLSGGLPLSILLLSRRLIEIPVEKWDLRGSSPEDLLKRFSEDDSPALEFCYKQLPLRLRPCLLYFANFPEDLEIEMDTLCQLWIAEGLISMDDARNGETMIDVAKRYLDELVRGNFVMMPKEEVWGQRRFCSCRIHDMIRDFCLENGKEDGIFEFVAWDTGTTATSRRRAIYLDKYEGTREPVFTHFFSKLKVLYLHGIYFRDGKLPKGVEELVYLRYLGFRECYLTELFSNVRNMFYLQTLDLRVRNECEMTIPADTFNNLERMNYLYFPLAYRTHNDEKLRLNKLKDLEILDNFDPSMCNAADLLVLTNLKELAVTAEGDVEEIKIILHALDKNSSNWRSTSLNIRHFDCRSYKRFSAMEEVFNSSALHALEVEGSFRKLPEFERSSSKLTMIVLNGSELDEDPMQILQDLTNLRTLILEIEAYKGERMKCSSNGFLELRYLKLSKLYNLQIWEVEIGAMPKLRTLIIESCKKLPMLPDLQGSHPKKNPKRRHVFHSFYLRWESYIWFMS